MWIGFLLAACQTPSPSVSVEATFTTAEPPSIGPVVTYDDGTRLLASTVSAASEPGQPLEMSATFALASAPESLEFEATLWRAGDTRSAAKWRIPPPASWPEGAVRIELSPMLPDDTRPGPYWVQWQVRRDGEVLEAPPFGNGRVAIGVTQIDGTAPRAWPERPAKGPTLAVSGDVNLGRRMHTVFEQKGARAPLAAGVKALAEADLAYVNLECAVGVGGTQGVDKGELTPFYYRARPETLAMLTTAGVDVVGVANNHAGDYGLELLAAEDALLAEVGISMTGAGPDAGVACAPVFRKAGDLTVAFFAVDTTMPHFAAGDAPGTCYADITSPGGMTRRVGPAIREARKVADLVFVGVHWGSNRKPRPTAEARRAGHELIGVGADGVLGSSAHSLQGIEIHRGRPILFDTGNLLFDSIDTGETTRGGVFELSLESGGVSRVTVTPLDVGYGRTTVARGNSAARSLLRLRDLSAELGTATRFDGQQLVVDLPAPPPRPRPSAPAPADDVGSATPAPATEPPPGCLVDAVPEDAAIPPTPADGMMLLGVRLETDELSDRRGVWLESWWTADEGPSRDRLITARVQFERPSEKTLWGADHEPCDWGWPTSRWVPGAIYRDRYLLRPRPTFPDGRYQVTLGDVPVGHIDVDSSSRQER